MLASCYAKLGDNAGYAFTLEKLLVYYPSKEYWAEAIRRVETQAGLRRAAARSTCCGCGRPPARLGGTADYAAMAQLALAAGVTGRGETDLRSRASRPARWARAPRPSSSGGCATRRRSRWPRTRSSSRRARRPPAPRADGTALVNVGFAYVSAGQFDNGLALMEQGIAEGRPAAARRREAAPRDRLSRGGPEGRGRRGVPRRRRHRRHGRSRAPVARSTRSGRQDPSTCRGSAPSVHDAPSC